MAGSATIKAGPICNSAPNAVDEATRTPSKTAPLTATSARNASAPWQMSKAAPSLAALSRSAGGGESVDAGESVDSGAGAVSGDRIVAARSGNEGRR